MNFRIGKGIGLLDLLACDQCFRDTGMGMNSSFCECTTWQAPHSSSGINIGSVAWRALGEMPLVSRRFSATFFTLCHRISVMVCAQLVHTGTTPGAFLCWRWYNSIIVLYFDLLRVSNSRWRYCENSNRALLVSAIGEDTEQWPWPVKDTA